MCFRDSDNDPADVPIHWTSDADALNPFPAIRTETDSRRTRKSSSLIAPVFAEDQDRSGDAARPAGDRCDGCSDRCAGVRVVRADR